MFQLIEGATGRWSRKTGEVYEESAGFVLICQQCHGCCYTVQLGALQLYLEWDLQHRIEFPAQEVVNDIGVCLKQSPEDVMLHFWRDLGETDRQTCLLMAPHCYFLPITCLRLWYLNLPPSPSSSFLLGAPIFFFSSFTGTSERETVLRCHSSSFWLVVSCPKGVQSDIVWVESDRKDGTCLRYAPQLSLSETSNNPYQINIYMCHEEFTFLQVTSSHVLWSGAVNISLLVQPVGKSSEKKRSREDALRKLHLPWTGSDSAQSAFEPLVW